MLHGVYRCDTEGELGFVEVAAPADEALQTVARPALANERVQTSAAGQLVLKLRALWRDCTTHLVKSPLEFMQRLAALVPRPRLHLIRFHSVLTPNAKLRRWRCRRVQSRPHK